MSVLFRDEMFLIMASEDMCGSSCACSLFSDSVSEGEPSDELMYDTVLVCFVRWLSTADLFGIPTVRVG